MEDTLSGSQWRRLLSQNNTGLIQVSVEYIQRPSQMHYHCVNLVGGKFRPDGLVEVRKKR
jgi:hypothetical protein